MMLFTTFNMLNKYEANALNSTYPDTVLTDDTWTESINCMHYAHTYLKQEFCWPMTPLHHWPTL